MCHGAEAEGQFLALTGQDYFKMLALAYDLK